MDKFNWKLEHKDTIYRKVETYETVDKQLLYGFINNNMGITHRGNKKYNATGIKYESEQIPIANYLGLEREGISTPHIISPRTNGVVPIPKTACPFVYLVEVQDIN